MLQSRRMVRITRPLVSKMRRGRLLLLLAALCVLCCSQLASADDASHEPQQEAARGTGGSAAGIPESEAGEEADPVGVGDGLKQWYHAVKEFWMTLAHGDIEEVADCVMEKLKWYLFGTRHVQEKTWRQLHNAFRNHLRQWWLTTPSVPAETLKTGVWYALSKLATEDLRALWGGKPEYEKVKQLLLDESVIEQWVDDVQRRLTRGGLRRWVELMSYLRWGPDSRKEEEPRDSAAEQRAWDRRRAWDGDGKWNWSARGKTWREGDEDLDWSLWRKLLWNGDRKWDPTEWTGPGPRDYSTSRPLHRSTRGRRWGSDGAWEGDDGKWGGRFWRKPLWHDDGDDEWHGSLRRRRWWKGDGKWDRSRWKEVGPWELPDAAWLSTPGEDERGRDREGDETRGRKPWKTRGWEEASEANERRGRRPWRREGEREEERVTIPFRRSWERATRSVPIRWTNSVP